MKLIINRLLTSHLVAIAEAVLEMEEAGLEGVRGLGREALPRPPVPTSNMMYHRRTSWTRRRKPVAEVWREEITGPSAWVGPEIQDDTSWILRFPEEALDEIDSALASVEEKGLGIPFGKGDFPLGRGAEFLSQIPPILEERLGLALVRGIDRSRYTAAQCESIYWEIGVHLGTPISQNTRGHLLGHVRDEGRSFDDPTARGYQTSAKMDFHADQLPVDVLGLFCVRAAKEGGESALVSVGAVHNALLEERPDLLEILYEPFNLDWRGEEPEGEPPWYTSPMFSYTDGKVTSRVTNRQYFESVARYGEELVVTDVQREALDAVQEVANRPELRLSMLLEEGDMQFLNNHAILHARTAFQDYDDPDLKRHLLRIRIALPEGQRRSLSSDPAERYSIVESGGIPARAPA